MASSTLTATLTEGDGGLTYGGGSGGNPRTLTLTVNATTVSATGTLLAIPGDILTLHVQRDDGSGVGYLVGPAANGTQDVHWQTPDTPGAVVGATTNLLITTSGPITLTHKYVALAGPASGSGSVS